MRRRACGASRCPLAAGRARNSCRPLLVVPYVVIAAAQHMFRWQWFALYAGLPVVIAWLLARAAAADPEQRGNWRDAVILLTLGLAVDLRWFDVAWPAGLRGLANLLLVDAGLYGFLAIRRLSGTGFDFHLRWSDWKSDWKTGLRELLFFAPACSCWDTRSALSIPMPTCRPSARQFFPGQAFLFLSPSRKSFSFAPGCKIFSNAASDAVPR
jgi:hypothetical protein